jgi:hypothetical protein
MPSISAGSTTLVMPSAPAGMSNETIYVQGLVIATAQLEADRSGINNQINAQVSHYRAQLDYLATCYGAAKTAEAHKYSADRQLEASLAQLDRVNGTELSIRQREIDSRYQLAALQIQAGREEAQVRGAYDVQVAQIRSTSDREVAQVRGGFDVQTTQIDTATRVQVASINKDAQVQSAGIDLQGRQYSSDRSYAAQLYEADKSLQAAQLRDQGETARLQTKLQFAQSKFDTVYPFVQSSLSDALSGSPSTPGLDNDWPIISARGIYTPAEIQQQVNRAWAQNDARSQSQLWQLQSELAGRGFSGNSPLFDVIRVGVLGQTLRANNDAATSIRFQAATANADHILKAQELRVNEHQARNNTALESEKNQITRQVGFVGALAQLVGGIA